MAITSDLNDMKLVELRELAKQMHLRGTSAMNKAELLATLQAARSGGAAPKGVSVRLPEDSNVINKADKSTVERPNVSNTSGQAGRMASLDSQQLREQKSSSAQNRLKDQVSYQAGDDPSENGAALPRRGQAMYEGRLQNNRNNYGAAKADESYDASDSAQLGRSAYVQSRRRLAQDDANSYADVQDRNTNYYQEDSKKQSNTSDFNDDVLLGALDIAMPMQSRRRGMSSDDESMSRERSLQSRNDNSYDENDRLSSNDTFNELDDILATLHDDRRDFDRRDRDAHATSSRLRARNANRNDEDDRDSDGVLRRRGRNRLNQVGDMDDDVRVLRRNDRADVDDSVRYRSDIVRDRESLSDGESVRGVSRRAYVDYDRNNYDNAPRQMRNFDDDLDDQFDPRSRNALQEDESAESVQIAGIVDVLDSYAFIRTSGYLPGANDVYVSMGQIKKYGLRKGDAVLGTIKANRETDKKNTRQKFMPLQSLIKINDLDVELSAKRPHFAKLTPLYPQERLRQETTSTNTTGRLIDLIAPIGKGQRGMIVSPPKAGKTLTLQSIAKSITANNPEVHLMVVLVDERPEEVTDMERTVEGEVISSTFDRPATDHTMVAELAIERAKRLVELGQDVVVLLDSMTRLARAYNIAAPTSGRVLSGGVDAQALYPPKKFFGAARNIENGGSLTIISSALVETGSKMDEVIFEEFKGTGNMELRLSRNLADKRLFPAIDINASGTRREELITPSGMLPAVYALRRLLGGMEDEQAYQTLVPQLKKTKNNGEFLAGLAGKIAQMNS